MMRYEHTVQMGQISGYSGEYEARCQRMLDAGVRWVLAEKEKRELWFPPQDGLGRIFYIVNESASAISVLEGLFREVGSEPSLVQMHAVLNRVMYVYRYGWDQYVDVCEMAHNYREPSVDKNLLASPAELELVGGTYERKYFMQSPVRPDFKCRLYVADDGSLMWTPAMTLWTDVFHEAVDPRSVFPVWIAHVQGVVCNGVVFPSETVVEKFLEGSGHA